MDEALPNPPAQLKALLPFVQRANELRTADKVIAYWCCYYAAQLGISGNPSDKEAKMYLLTLMDTLEDLKSKLSDNDAVTNDAASSAYVENFALKVFVGADNQDRAGKATRATAKTFLAASQFIELLKIFGTIEPEMQEKIKYAKWKAADIAKAFKEGRKPTPGPAGGDPKLEAASVEAAMGPEAVTKDEQEYLAREMAKLTTGVPEESVAGAGTAGPDVADPGKEATTAPSTSVVLRSQRLRLIWRLRALPACLGAAARAVRMWLRPQAWRVKGSGVPRRTPRRCGRGGAASSRVEPCREARLRTSWTRIARNCRPRPALWLDRARVLAHVRCQCRRSEMVCRSLL